MVSPANTGAGRVTLSQPRLATMFWLMSSTLNPVQRERQAAVHQWPTEFGMRGVVRIEVDLVCIAGEKGEPCIVGLAHGLPRQVSIDVTNLEVFKEPSLVVIPHADPPVP